MEREKTEDSSSTSLSNLLLCTEDEASFIEYNEEDDENEEIDRFFTSDSDFSLTEEYIQILVEKETSFQAKEDCTVENWLKCARSDAIRWILKMREFFGFSFRTAYLSVTYFDRFLSRRLVDVSEKAWAIWLLSAACLSLAAKMEECKVPPLSEFREKNFKFENKVITRMELLVLTVLEWRMRSVTPFAYLNYFIVKFSDEQKPKALILKTVELILAAMEVINLVEHRPSAIAAAAVLVASDQRLTRTSMDFKMGAIAGCESSINESAFCCYNLMWELEKRKSRIYPSPAGVLDAASIASAGSKRRLEFDDYDINSHTSDKKKTN